MCLGRTLDRARSLALEAGARVEAARREDAEASQAFGDAAGAHGRAAADAAGALYSAAMSIALSLAGSATASSSAIRPPTKATRTTIMSRPAGATTIPTAPSTSPVPAPMDKDAPTLVRLLAWPAAPASRLGAILGLLALTAFVLWIASRAVRRMQISYGAEA